MAKLYNAPFQGPRYTLHGPLASRPTTAKEETYFHDTTNNEWYYYTSSAWNKIGKSDVLLKDGTIGLTADWDAGSIDIQAETFTSDVPIGTAPLTVTSTTKVTNLNSDQVDGSDLSDLLAKEETPYLGRGTNYQITAGDYIIAVTCVGTDIDVTLPNPTLKKTVIIKKLDSTSHAVNIEAYDGENIEDSATDLILTHQYDSVTLSSNGINWFIV